MSFCYDRALIERTLPCLWDSVLAAHGVPSPEAPDPDMPRGYKNPAHSGDQWVHVADVRRAWGRAELSKVQRQRVLMRYGLDWTLVDIAEYYDVGHPRVDKSINDAITKIAVELNGHVQL